MVCFKSGIIIVQSAARKWNYWIAPTHYFELCMKRFISISIMIIIVGATCLVWFNHPKNLASSANNIPEFFGVPLNSVKGMTVLDELHSQGKTLFSFGINHYWLKFQSTDLTIKAVKDVGGIAKDSIWSITKQRGNYIGILMVSQKDHNGHVRYSEIQE